MNLPQHAAKHFRDVHFGGNWTSVNLKDSLADVNWQLAGTQVYSCNTIAGLVFHIHYYTSAVLKVLQGEPLNAHDKFSFYMPPIQCREDWENMLNKVWTDAEKFASLVEQMPEHRMWENLDDEKYGTWYRNIHGIIEHTHYHLGQIVLIKKILAEANRK
jgi:hypothetical protein